MSMLPFRGREPQPACACCHDAGWLPSPLPAYPGDWVPCPCCHQDWRWTIADADDDGASLMDVAFPLDDGEQEGGQPCDC
jgi:hypothetical protein